MKIRIKAAVILLNLSICFAVILAAGCKEDHTEITAEEMAAIHVEEYITQKTDLWIEGVLPPGTLEKGIVNEYDASTSDLATTLVLESDDSAIVEVKYVLLIELGEQTIEGNVPGIEMNIDPQVLRWDAVMTIELTLDDDQWQVDNFYSGAYSDEFE